MEIKRRTQEERSAATRDALISAARRLWGLWGHAEVGTPEIAKEAGVTRGAMYHQFADKATLFSEVVETVEQDVMAGWPPWWPCRGPRHRGRDRAAVDARLEVSDPCAAADPAGCASVLGCPAFRDVAQRYSLGMTENRSPRRSGRASCAPADASPGPRLDPRARRGGDGGRDADDPETDAPRDQASAAPLIDGMFRARASTR